MLFVVTKEQENYSIFTFSLVGGITCRLVIEACQNSGNINGS